MDEELISKNLKSLSPMNATFTKLKNKIKRNQLEVGSNQFQKDINNTQGKQDNYLVKINLIIIYIELRLLIDIDNSF